jgi:hypothetical protein
LNVRDRFMRELPGLLWLGQSAPLGWLALQRSVLLALGTSEMALRLIPLLFGLGTVVGAVWVGARWMTRLGAALLVALCAFGPWLSFFPFEVKHYSSDAFWALLLPALAAWAVDSASAATAARRRWTVWWMVAAAALWFGNGALFVTPACAVVLFAEILRRHGARAGLQFAVTGLAWVTSATAHYALALEPAHHSTYLRTYWANNTPPESLGFVQRLGWVADRLDPLALNPAGAGPALAFWICVAAGFAFTHHRTVGRLFATVPLSAVALAVLGLVPLYERLALWIVPALYVGLALLMDIGVRLALQAWKGGRPFRIVPAMLFVGAALTIAADIVSKGTPILDFGPRTTNHGLDDRNAVAWLMQQRQPGDAILTTRLGWPALWWYGPVPLRSVPLDGRLPDGSVMYEVSHSPRPDGCGPPLHSALLGHRHALVHVGFPDMPNGFFELVLRELAPFGAVLRSHRFGDSLVAVVGPGKPSLPPPQHDPALEGCVGLRPAQRW